MHKLTAVEEAKTLFEEAKDWGVWRWLMEKRRARQTADAAWEALDEYEKKVKASWGQELKKAAATNGNGRAKRSDVDPELKLALQRLKTADEEAYKARMDAEAQIDEADRRLSTSMAREGAQMAIDAWAMREKLIRKMEALGRRE
jgi:hypothetical protein